MIFNSLHSKRGSTLVEASLVWPFMILSVLAVLTIIMSLFSESVVLSASHMSLRKVSGQWTQTVALSEQLPMLREPLYIMDVPKRLVEEEEFWMSQNRIPIPRKAVEGDFVFYVLYPDFSLQTFKNYGGFGLLRKQIEKKVMCHYQGTDEAQLIRNWDYAVELVKEVKNNEEKQAGRDISFFDDGDCKCITRNCYANRNCFVCSSTKLCHSNNRTGWEINAIKL